MRIRELESAILEIQKAKKSFEEMNKKYPKKYAEELYLVGDNIITEWYSQYDPIFYERSGSLYNAFKVNLNGVNYSVEFDSSFIDGNELIFQNSFIEGYHGGAKSGENHPSPGIPYWRTPIPQFTEWGRPAKRSFSPYIRMIQEMNKKIKEIDKEKQEEYDKIIEKVEKKINKLG